MSPAETRVKRDEATITQRANFLEAASASQVGLQDAITALKKKLLDQSLTFPERNAIEAEIAELEARLAKVQARIMTFLANRGGVRPPSAKEVETFRQLSGDLHTLVVGATTVDAIVSGAARLYRVWNKIA